MLKRRILLKIQEHKITLSLKFSTKSSVLRRVQHPKCLRKTKISARWNLWRILFGCCSLFRKQRTVYICYSMKMKQATRAIHIILDFRWERKTTSTEAHFMTIILQVASLITWSGNHFGLKIIFFTFSLVGEISRRLKLEVIRVTFKWKWMHKRDLINTASTMKAKKITARHNVLR
jgi:hypothetical protein